MHYYYYYLSVCFNYLSFLLSIASPYQLYRKRSRARCRHSSEQRGRMGVLPRPSSLPCLLKRVLSHPRGEGAGGSPPSLLPRVLVGVLQPGAPGGSNFSLGSELPWGAEGKGEPGRALGTPPSPGKGARSVTGPAARGPWCPPAGSGIPSAGMCLLRGPSRCMHGTGKAPNNNKTHSQPPPPTQLNSSIGDLKCMQSQRLHVGVCKLPTSGTGDSLRDLGFH